MALAFLASMRRSVRVAAGFTLALVCIALANVLYGVNYLAWLCPGGFIGLRHYRANVEFITRRLIIFIALLVEQVGRMELVCSGATDLFHDAHTHNRHRTLILSNHTCHLGNHPQHSNTCVNSCDPQVVFLCSALDDDQC
jgi:hypothetical protein